LAERGCDGFEVRGCYRVCKGAVGATECRNGGCDLVEKRGVPRGAEAGEGVPRVKENVVRRLVGAEYGAELVEEGLRRGGGARRCRGIEELGCGAGRGAGVLRNRGARGCSVIEERWSNAGWKTVA
jgi:hypothetical protein